MEIIIAFLKAAFFYVLMVAGLSKLSKIYGKYPLNFLECFYKWPLLLVLERFKDQLIYKLLIYTIWIISMAGWSLMLYPLYDLGSLILFSLIFTFLLSIFNVVYFKRACRL